MANCDLCNQDMLSGASCSVEVLHTAGVAYPLVPHRAGRARSNCGDCGVEPGGFHHLGCDLQRCPRCGGQLISCGCCRWDELRDEYVDTCTDDEYDLDEETADGQDLEATESPPWPLDRRAVAPRGRLDFGAAVAPLRAKHHRSLAAFARWALADGRSCDLDVVALCLALLHEDLTEHGYRLDRPAVSHAVWPGATNHASLLDTTLPEHWQSSFWELLHWLDASGQFAEGSDPLAALVEPLRCAGGLDQTGRPREEGQDVDFPCQCYHRHNPQLRADLMERTVGRDPATFEPFVVQARSRLRSDPVTEGDEAPLLALHRRLRDRSIPGAAPLLEFSFFARVDAVGSSPELWLFDPPLELSRRGFDCVAVDATGRTWIPRPDGRCAAGHRWEEAEPATALRRSGIAVGWPRQFKPTGTDGDDATAVD